MIVYEVIGIEHSYDSGEYSGSWIFDNRDSAQRFLNEQKKYGDIGIEWIMSPKNVLETMPELLWKITVWQDDRLLPATRKYQDAYEIVDETKQVCNEVKEEALSPKVTKYTMYVKAQTFDEAMLQSTRLVNDYEDTKNEVTYL